MPWANIEYERFLLCLHACKCIECCLVDVSTEYENSKSWFSVSFLRIVADICSENNYMNLCCTRKCHVIYKSNKHTCERALLNW